MLDHDGHHLCQLRLPGSGLHAAEECVSEVHDQPAHSAGSLECEKGPTFTNGRAKAHLTVKEGCSVEIPQLLPSSYLPAVVLQRLNS